jgi:hypothetical protein
MGLNNMPNKEQELHRQIDTLVSELNRLRAEADQERHRPKCLSCRFFEDAGSDDTGWGQCKRNAPVPIFASPVQAMAAEDRRVLFPPMHQNAWCGEWNPSQWRNTRETRDEGFA